LSDITEENNRGINAIAILFECSVGLGLHSLAMWDIKA
jgi:hypothetical protein